MLQSRLCTPDGFIIGSLRGGRFIVGDGEEVFGIRYQYCDDSMSNDSITHSDNRKKFLIEVLWTTDRDVGAVQFLLTVAAEDELYWERWRPRAGLIRPRWAKDVPVVESLFKIEVSPGRPEPTLSPEEEASTFSPEELATSEPFDPKIFEEIEAAEENAMNQVVHLTLLLFVGLKIIKASRQGTQSLLFLLFYLICSIIGFLSFMV
ncbi:hypothetical protein COOONC_04349 [Cooperia oncophora]